jgi:hypothetical protein
MGPPVSFGTGLIPAPPRGDVGAVNGVLEPLRLGRPETFTGRRTPAVKFGDGEV